MNVSREKIALALFAQLQSMVGSGEQPNGKPQFPYQTFQRAPLMWSKVNAADMPAAFLFKPLENVSSKDVYGAKEYVLQYILLVYIKADPSHEIIETTMNQALDAIDGALDIDGEPQTLAAQNGNVPLVNNAYSNGVVDFGLDALTNQCWFAIRVLVETGS